MSDDELDELVRDLRAASEEMCDGPYATTDPDLDHPMLLRWAADEIERLQASNHAALAALKRVRDDAVLMADQLAGKSPLVGPLHLGIVYADDVLSPSRTKEDDRAE